MLRLLTALVALRALASAAAGSEHSPATSPTSKTCQACSAPGQCTEITCPSVQDSCLLSQMDWGNGTVFAHGSCVAPEQCHEGVYGVTYGPDSGFWIRSACCEKTCRRNFPRDPAPKSQPNGVQCEYCYSENELTPCASLSVMNCTGNQIMCVTISGMWSGGHRPQILKGCATSNICQLPENTTTLGPAGSGFHLTSRPVCSGSVPSPVAGSHTATPYKDQGSAKVTTCFTCSDLLHCEPLSCTEKENHCLQITVISAAEFSRPFLWKNGSCVAARDCKSSNSLSGVGYWINAICCVGNCEEPPSPAVPTPASLSPFLCPTCLEGPMGSMGSCGNTTLYQQCPSGGTECVQLHMMGQQGSQSVKLIIQGCSSKPLCDSQEDAQRLLAFSGYQLTSKPNCSTSQRAVMATKCTSDVAPRLHLALPVLMVALGAATFS
ncbi:uncharacterized protein LOC142431549 isoform X2 [Tenrec ecaudatus]|uniref:uncharacterized protein LOC142431549 isoform X2 n=1 Tax=Tenrec ecaudatus TaxID=94439 RepID=UPI003F5ABCFC